MRRLKISLVIASVMIVIVFTALFFLGRFQPKGAGLLVNSTPIASVFIDGAAVGRTPYKMTTKPKEINLRLVPESTGVPLAVYETRLNLSPGIETVVNRELGETEEISSGEIVSFEKVGKGETSLSLISIPDAAQISIDGQVRGFAPYKTPSILSGEHQVVISAPGYNSRTLQVKTRESYKLIVIAKLSINLEDRPKSPEPVKSQEENKISVEILATPTGFLRVREEASTSSTEIGRVKPGEKYELVEETEGWYKITFEEGVSPERSRMGWVSSQYAKKLEESSLFPKSS